LGESEREQSVDQTGVSKYPAGLLLAVLVLLVILMNLVTSERIQIPLEPGSPSPDFQLTTLTVSVDENKEDVVRFRNEYKLSFPILLDPTTNCGKKFFYRFSSQINAYTFTTYRGVEAFKGVQQ